MHVKRLLRVRHSHSKDGESIFLRGSNNDIIVSALSNKKNRKGSVLVVRSIRFVRWCVGVWLLVLPLAMLLSVLFIFMEDDLSEGGTSIHEKKMSWPSTLEEAKLYDLQALEEVDRMYYTVRINTWKRLPQLITSLDHHSQCEGVQVIQVVWCDEQGPVPEEVLHHKSGKVVVERHEKNSLNERFHIIHDPPTRGILSMDDDVLRPCLAIDAGFFKWINSPDRIVGFDTRVHVIDEKDNRWKYGYLSTSEKTNTYSIVLPRFCFLHRDYLHLYHNALPRQIYSKVEFEFNCEDIAMSFFVSSLTDGLVPLLADYWAVRTLVKLPSSSTISGSPNHKRTRDDCVDLFANELGLKLGFIAVTARHKSSFDYGYREPKKRKNSVSQNRRMQAFHQRIHDFNEQNIRRMISDMKERTLKALNNKTISDT